MVTGPMNELGSTLNSLNDLGSKHVSILYSRQRISILIKSETDSSQEKLISLDSGDIKAMLDLFEPIAKDFHTVHFISTSPEVTLIPDGLFEETKAEEYLNQVFGTARGMTVINRHVTALSLRYVCRIASDVYLPIIQCFPQLQHRHLIESMMLETWADLKHGEDLLFRQHQEDENLFSLVFKGKSLLLSTHHRIGDATDIVYHALNTMNTFSIDPQAATLICSGVLAQDKETMELLKSYCPESQFKSARFNTVKAATQFILATQSYCES